MRPYVLAETTWKTVRENDYSVAILPWGATEAHNYHLPYATDNIQAEQVAIRAAERATSGRASSRAGLRVRAWVRCASCRRRWRDP